MKIYKVKVNGKVYEVELESVTETSEQITTEAKKAEESVSEPVEEKATPVVSSGEEVEVKAPMQGTILDVRVNVGDEVKKGQVLCILEAMKLENEIVSPVDGVIVSVNTSKGQNANNQELLFVIG